MHRRRIFKIAETGLMGVALWWGVVLLLPPKTFDNTMYMTLSNIMPEEGWATQCLVIALILMVGMITDKKLIRDIGLILSMGLWTFISVSLWLDDHVTTGTSYFVWALMSAGLYIHLMKVGDD